jgi:hypothetical protein
VSLFCGLDVKDSNQSRFNIEPELQKKKQ